MLPGFAQISAEDQEKRPRALDAFALLQHLSVESARRGKKKLCLRRLKIYIYQEAAGGKRESHAREHAASAAVCRITDIILCGFGPLGTNMGVMCFVRFADAPASIRAKCFRLPRYSPLSLSLSHTHAHIFGDKKAAGHLYWRTIAVIIKTNCFFCERERELCWGHVRHCCVCAS